MLPGGSTSRFPGLGQQPPAATVRPSMWYRFHVDLTANSSGVSVKSLIREAESARRKAAAAAASSAARVSPRPAGSTAPFSNGGAATASGPGTATTPAAFTNGVNGSNGLTTPGARDGAGDSAVGTIRQPRSVDGDFVATTGEVNRTGQPAREAGTAKRPTPDTINAEDVTGPEQSELAKIKNTSEDIHPASELLRDKNRMSGGLSLIERLELKYGGVASGHMPDSDQESSDMSSQEEPSSAEESGEGGGGDDEATEGGGRSGGEGGAKKVVKRTRKVKDDLDYDDTFIDDSELEKAFLAKEASQNAKTVHSGFFANQGEVETIDESSDDNSVSRKKGSGGGSAGGAVTGGVDSDFIQKRKKPKASEGGKSVDAVPPQKKKAKRKPAVSDGGNGGTRGATGLDNAVTTNTSTTTAAHPSASALSIVGKLSPVADNVGSVSCVATGTAGNAANTGANVSVVAREGGSGDGLGVHVGMAAAGASAAGVQGQVTETNSGSSASSAPSAATTAAAIHHYKANGGTPGIPMAMMVAGGVVTMERDAAGGVVVGMGSGDAATFGSDGGSGATVAAGSSAGKGGGDVKTAATNSILMGQSLDPALKIALARFEEDCKPWMEAGRPEGDGAAAAVLDGLLKMDALVRQSVESTHVPPPYVERLSAVYGKSALEIKSMLLALRREESKREYTRLRDELESLKTDFLHKVAANVTAQKGADGQPQSPSFHWTDPLRGLLHDLMRAFEAWATKALSGLRTKQAVIASKELYDQLSQAWPAELPMSADDLKKMYLNEKRRIKTKANKEAALTAPAGGSPVDLARDPVSKEATHRVAMVGAATTTTTAPSPAQKNAAGGAATAAGDTVVAAGVTVASPPRLSNFTGPPSVGHTTAVSPLTATPGAATVATVAAPSTPAAMRPFSHTMSTVPTVAASPKNAPVSAGAFTASVASSPHAPLPISAAVEACSSDAALTDTRLPSSLGFDFPPRAVTFEAPPEFDESDFFDEVDDDEDGVEESYTVTSYRGYDSVTDGQ